jgi:hypothetical protein
MFPLDDLDRWVGLHLTLEINVGSLSARVANANFSLLIKDDFKINRFSRDFSFFENLSFVFLAV